LLLSAETPENLLLRIYSFSFHQGAPPKDETGHGGGFVFDARGLPNPGREARFKQLTGKDASVIEYLKQHKSVDEFLAGATGMVESSVNSYLERGFKNLMVSFGCTGGQHRSVYLAESMARHFRTKPGVEVRLRHLELEKLGK
jgi:RNase adaptor protein for sRNA GlmZ degradation